jgi:phage/plasmid primase-like uncharacterized protein
MGLPLQLPITLTSIDCGECGGVYAINERYRKQREDNAGTWNCPYCQVSWGYGKGALQRANEELAAETARKKAALERANAAEAEALKLQREAARLKARAKAGVCPCCNRTFKQLAAHMKNKHPEKV